MSPLACRLVAAALLAGPAVPASRPAPAVERQPRIAREGAKSTVRSGQSSRPVEERTGRLIVLDRDTFEQALAPRPGD